MRTLILALLLIGSTTLFSQALIEPKTRCTSTTTKGTQCKNTATMGVNCVTHSLDTPTCGKRTKRGEPCKRKVKNYGDICKQHQ
jgi:hypothetical protein